MFTRASEYLKIVMFSGSKEIYMLNLQHILRLLGKLSVKNVQGWQKKKNHCSRFAGLSYMLGQLSLLENHTSSFEIRILLF